ncbi:unnamed protein product [Paramecium octaurelia]|uniref:Uncharacterized protein n=1 Tax=Paramecium octaurelia TaxID=43137 RepID=A0A8S1X4J4_PAROT|nr:unnamed protein product [Paramecium octaurelia]
MHKLFNLTILLLLGFANCQDATHYSTENIIFDCVFFVIFVLVVISIIRAIIMRRRRVVLVGLVEDIPPQNVVVVHQVPTNPNQYPPQFVAPPAQNPQFVAQPAQNLQYQDWVQQQNQAMPQQQQPLPPQYPPYMNQNYYPQQAQQYPQNVQAYPANPVYPQQGIPISQPQGYPK